MITHGQKVGIVAILVRMSSLKALDRNEVVKYGIEANGARKLRSQTNGVFVVFNCTAHHPITVEKSKQNSGLE